MGEKIGPDSSQADAVDHAEVARVLDAAARLRASGASEEEVHAFVDAQYGVDPKHLADQYPSTDEIDQ